MTGPTDDWKTEDRDPLLDALLDEVVGEQSPPDLTARILERWREQSGVSPGEQRLAPPPVQRIGPQDAVQSRSVNGNGRARREATADPQVTDRRARAWLIGLATAAVALIAVSLGGLALLNRGDAIQTGRPSQGTNEIPNGPTPPIPSKQNGQKGQEGSFPGAGSELASRPSSDETKTPAGSVFDEEPPFGRETPGKLAAEAPRTRQRPAALPDEDVVAEIDRLVAEAWNNHEVSPSPSATDEEFCRRLYLAMLGRIPTVDELHAFTDDRSPDKRSRWIVRLQRDADYSDQYVANWTTFWSNTFLGRSGGVRPGELASRDGLQGYLRDAIANNRPYDKLVFELLTATGANRPGEEDFNGATNFLLAGMAKQGELATARTARIFHGRQIQCVQCHNHPTNENWTQNQFWELNAFLRQTDVVADKDGVVRLVNRDFAGESGQDVDEAEVYYERLDGVKRVAYPVFLDGRQISKSGSLDVVDRRRELAGFIVDSPDLARAAVNRIWSRFYQYGFTRSVDDMGPHSEVSHPELLEHLATQFEAHDYDVDRLVRWLADSKPFHLSSRVSQDALADAPEAGSPPLFSRYYTRQLSPEAVYDSLLLAADSRSDDSGGHRLAQRAWVGQFSRSMGTDEGDEANSFIGDIGQSVTIMTSPLMDEATNGTRGVLHAVVKSKMSDAEKIEHLFLAALSRKPTARELKAVTRVLHANAGDAAAGLQDIWWALLNSNEFLLDH